MHWSKRELARRVGISPTSVHRPIDRTSGPFLVDLLRPGLAMGQASSSLITRTEAGWARRLAGVTCGDWLSPGSGPATSWRRRLGRSRQDERAAGLAADPRPEVAADPLKHQPQPLAARGARVAQPHLPGLHGHHPKCIERPGVRR